MLSRQLLTFIEVVETGSFSKAADKLYITKAAVMNQINALEDRMDVKLVNRTSQGISLTPAGKSLYTAGLRMVKESKRAVAYAKKLNTKDRIDIRVGSSILYPAKRLIQIWNRIGDEHREFRIRVVPFEDDYRTMPSILTNLGEKIDIILGSCDAESLKQVCQAYEVGSDALCCAVPLSHPLARKERVCLEDLEGEDLIMVPAGTSPVLDRFRKELNENHPHIHITDTHPYYDLDTFNECASGTAVLLSLDIWEDVNPFLKTIPLDTGYRVPNCILCPKDMPVELKMFVDYLLESMNETNGTNDT